SVARALISWRVSPRPAAHSGEHIMSFETRVIETLPVVEAELDYLIPVSQRPRNYPFDPPPGVPRSNAKHEAHRVSIHDLRPVAENAELDEQGFGVVRHRSAVRDFWDDDEVRRVYYPEVEAELTRATG